MSRKLSTLDKTSLAGNPRASLSAWMRYEHIIVAAFRMSPSSYIYCPNNMAPCTVASRLRDATRGMLCFHYPCAVPHASLLAWYEDIIIKHDDTQVYIGLPSAYTSTVTGVVSSPDSTTLTFPSLTLEELIAFTVLLSTGRVVGPILIHHPPDSSLVPDRPNVELFPRPDGTLLIL